MSDGWLVWMWRHHTLEVNEWSDRETAIGVALSTEDNGDGVLECIEGPDGVVATEVIEREWDARRERERAEWDQRPVMTHGLRLTAPDGSHSAWWDSYPSQDAAEKAVAELRPRFGGRLKIEKFRT